MYIEKFVATSGIDLVAEAQSASISWAFHTRGCVDTFGRQIEPSIPYRHGNRYIIEQRDTSFRLAHQYIDSDVPSVAQIWIRVRMYGTPLGDIPEKILQLWRHDILAKFIMRGKPLFCLKQYPIAVRRDIIHFQILPISSYIISLKFTNILLNKPINISNKIGRDSIL